MAASQSYWRFKDDSASQSDSLTEDEAVNNPSNIWEILSGTDVTGSYVMDDLVAATEYENLVTYGGRSILPSGELFRIYNITSSENSAPVTQSFLTDIKLWRGDSFDKW